MLYPLPQRNAIMFSIVYNGKIAVSSVFDNIPEPWLVVDCRPLIDGPGNSDELIQNILNLALEKLHEGNKICFACDYGHSRSNLLAALAISRIAGISIRKAVENIKFAHPESSIKPGILKHYISDFFQNAITKRTFAITGA